ncbi:hypothetical protein E2C01_036288 [Portunus trituberculatus]|uniref:Uncharacterized protein n=1 Tax=Portunus trituberculatus TaxID=210409 RepID=A0A5B7F6D5_PORTR|nr:hypothetical protein [Portunus trituberculatus]
MLTSHIPQTLRRCAHPDISHPSRLSCIQRQGKSLVLCGMVEPAPLSLGVLNCRVNLNVYRRVNLNVYRFYFLYSLCTEADDTQDIWVSG